MKNLAIKALAISLFSAILISLFNPGFQHALSSDGMWTTSWPSGGIIYGVAVDPTNPANVYVASVAGGFFRSTDGGASWKAINNGLSGLYTSEIAIQPNSPATLYGYSDYAVWKSTNSGGSWTKAFDSSAVYQIVFAPANPAIIFIATNFGLLRSQNNGRSWETIYPNGQAIAVFDLTIDPQNSNVLYASVANLTAPGEWLGIFKSTDGGDTWTPANNGINDLIIRSIAVDKQIPSQVYACSEAGKVYKSSNSGESWTEIFSRVGCFDIVASGGIVYSAQTGVSKSSDGGETWSTNATSFMALELRFDPQNSNIVYAACWNGMQKTSDGGLTWTPINNGLTAENLTAVMVDPDNPTTIFASGWSSGLWKSTDNGVSWFNLQPDMVYIEKLVADPLRPDTLYANGNRSVDGGVTFTDLGVHKITLDPNNQDVLYSHYGYGSSVAKSVDWGATWNSLSTPLIENEGISTLIVDPLNPNLVYLATMTTARVFKSTTGGASWTGAYSGLPPCQGTPVCSKSIQVLTADPVTSGVLYAGLDEYGLGIYKTTDFGAHWYPKNNGLTNLDIRSISIDPTNASTIYAGTYGGGVFRSLDGGEYWSPYNNGLQGSTHLLADNLPETTPEQDESLLEVLKPSMKVKGLVVNPDYTINLHASTEGGVYSINNNVVPINRFSLNHNDGQPGSYFIGNGSRFAIRTPAEVWVNGLKLGELTASYSGGIDFRLDTQLANPGRYTVVVKTPQKIVMGHFILDPLAEQHTGGDELVTFNIPAGIEMDQIVYLPLVRR